jgi:hypothetical protein
MMRYLQFAVLLLAVCSTFAAFGDEPPKHLTREQALKDTKTFFALLEATHADPYTNLGGKIEFKRKAGKLEKDLPADGLSVPELGDRLGVFLAPLRDGHTRIRGSRARWQDPSPRLAVQFSIVADGLVLTAFDLPELKGTQGDRLVAVNGHTIPDLMHRMLQEVSSENKYGSYYGVMLALRSFKLLKNLLPDLDRAQGVRYTLEDAKGDSIERTVRWDGEHPEDPVKWSDKPMEWTGIPHPKQPYYYEFLNGNQTAYFRVESMVPRESYEIMKGYKVGDLKEMLADYYKRQKKDMPPDIDAAIRGVPSITEPATRMVEEMKKFNTRNVIIDLRGNGGGSTPVIVPFFYEIYGDDYFGRKDDAEFVQVKSPLWMLQYHTSVEEQRKKEPDFEVGEYEFTGDEPGTAEEKRNKKFAEWKEKGLNWATPLEAQNGKPAYRPPKVVVLCDPGTFSAAFQAMFLLHQMGAAVVGVPSAQSPNAFMEGTEFTLPESGIKGLISNGMQMFMPNDPKANVYHPDFEVSYSVFAKYGGDADLSLRYALDLIAAGKI